MVIVLARFPSEQVARQVDALEGRLREDQQEQMHALERILAQQQQQGGGMQQPPGGALAALAAKLSAMNGVPVVTGGIDRRPDVQQVADVPSF